MKRPDDVDEDATLRVFRVPAESAGMRADVFLQSQLRNTSRTRARLILETTAYDGRGKRLRASDRLREGDEVALWRPPFEPALAPVELRVLHEDPHLLVIDKPAPLTVHPTARVVQNTVLTQLQAQRPGEYVSLIHRLDRDTSGVLLIARNTDSDRAFKRLLEDRSSAEIVRRREETGVVETAPGAQLSLERAARRGSERPMRKLYLAIARGEPPEGDVESPLEPDPSSTLRVKMRVAAPGSGLDARTRFTVLERRGEHALMLCELFTGRQHQIRVHLAAHGAPVVGDKLYGADERLLARAADGELTEEDERLLVLPRHALHAHVYELAHAVTGEALRLEAPLSPDLRAFWDTLS
jgi:23S rRNA pseudouridine1911/1915/1917 synthase